MSKASASDKIWLFAFKDSLANLNAFSNCVTTVDVMGDGENRLLVADGSKKIKQFGGTSLQTEVPLLSVPSAIASFYSEQVDAFNRPVVAVATGPYIFMYRNNKPLYRFMVPYVPIDTDEQEVWDSLMEGHISIEEAVELLGQKVDAGGNVCTRTIDLLLMDNSDERQAFLAELLDKPLRQYDLVTCMATLMQDSPDPLGKGMLCFCTENRLLYLLRNNGTEVEKVVDLPSVGVQLICAGYYKGEYRIIVSCRDGRIYSLKNGVLHSAVIQPDAQPVSMARYDNFIMVATTSNTVTSFNLKGKKQHTIYMPCPVTNLATITDPVAGTAKGLLVALNNGELRIYVGKHLQHTSQLHDTVSALYFGRYGREDSALMIVLKTGALLVYLLHRKAVFSQQKDLETVPPPEQDIPIAVPKLSSVFSLQTEREKKYGLDMYKTFQYDLCVLRLHTAKAYWQLISGGAPVPGSEVEPAPVALPPPDAAVPHATVVDAPAEAAVPLPAPVPAAETPAPIPVAPITEVSPMAALTAHLRIVATVQGLGPVFKLKLTLQNTTKKPLRDIFIVFLYAQDVYQMPKNLLFVPYVVPAMAYPCDALVQLQEGEVKGDGILAMAVEKKSARPLGLTLIDLPEAEILEGLN